MSIELAAVILTKNEERHIGDCLDSLAWADERVVFDAFSDDRTVEVLVAHLEDSDTNVRAAAADSARPLSMISSDCSGLTISVARAASSTIG